MALLAESLVEEWLNRTGFFTVRGIKHGVNEIDLLAIRREPDGTITAWHVEVQASFRPIGYISKFARQLAVTGENKRGRTSAASRTPAQVEVCAREWVQDKFRANSKIQVRERLWPGIEWSYHLVHAVVREPEELRVFESQGVKCHDFHQVLCELLDRVGGGFLGSAGGDLAEVVGYYSPSKAPSSRTGGRAAAIAASRSSTAEELG